MNLAPIAIVLPDLRGGGVERARILLAHEFVKQGHDVEFVVMRAEGELAEEAGRHFRVFELDILRARHLPIHLIRYLRLRRPRAVLAAMWPITCLTVLAARLSRVPCRVVISEHNNLDFQYGTRGRLHRLMLRTSMRVTYPLATARVGVSAGVVEGLSRLSGLRRERFQVIYNPVRQASSKSDISADAVENLWPPSPGFRVITVGRQKHQKNHALLLRAFAQLTQHVQAILMLVGDGPLQEDLRSLAESLGIGNQVIFSGFQEEITALCGSADLFVLSSDYEGFGNVIVEALACGTPVVSTDCPSGPAEILKHGEFGLLVPVGDKNALALAIQQSLQTEHNRAALKIRALDFAPAIAAGRYLVALTGHTDNVASL